MQIGYKDIVVNLILIGYAKADLGKYIKRSIRASLGFGVSMHNILEKVYCRDISHIFLKRIIFNLDYFFQVERFNINKSSSKVISFS